MDDVDDAPARPERGDYLMPKTTKNPFALDMVVRPVGALANAEQQRSVAEVQARMIIARSHPRDPMLAMDEILRDCTRPSLAEGALYQYARGGSSISGPSIRLAENIARRWGNIAAGIKEIGRSAGYSECVAYAWDLETGYYDERQFQIRHWRDTKSGGHALTDERDIYELIANMGQRRKRAVLLTVIPGDVVEAAVQQCEETLRADVNTSPEAMKRLVDAFAAFGVNKVQIEKRCQCRLEAIRPAQIVQLRRIYASLKDEMSQPKDWFDESVWTDMAERRKSAEETQRITPVQDDGPTPEKRPRGRPKQSAPPQETVIPPSPVQMNEREGRPIGDVVSLISLNDLVAMSSVKPEEPSGFSAWLVNAEGEPIEDADGGSGKYTDPVAYARALKDALDAEFPETRDLMEMANEEDAKRACELSADAAEILMPGVFDAGQQPAEAEPSLPFDDAPQVEDDYHQPDADLWSIPPPSSETKAEFERFNSELKLNLSSADTPEKMNAVIDANYETYNIFPPKYRMVAKALVHARMDELSPPQAAKQPQTMREIGDELIDYIKAAKTEDDLGALERNGAVVIQSKIVAEKSPEIWAEVRSAAKAQRAKIKAGG